MPADIRKIADILQRHGLDAESAYHQARSLDRFGVVRSIIEELCELKDLVESQPHIVAVWQRVRSRLEDIEQGQTVCIQLDKHNVFNVWTTDPLLPPPQ